jgi:hypothetical protein
MSLDADDKGGDVCVMQPVNFVSGVENVEYGGDVRATQSTRRASSCNANCSEKKMRNKLRSH